MNWNERLNIELRNRDNPDEKRLLEVIDELEAEVESLKADDERCGPRF